MRCADVLEKVSSRRPALLQPFKTRLLDEVAVIPQQKVQWHVAQMCGYLELNAAEKARVAAIMESYLASSSSAIVRVMALQTLPTWRFMTRLSRLGQWRSSTSRSRGVVLRWSAGERGCFAPLRAGAHETVRQKKGAQCAPFAIPAKYY